MGKKKAAKRDQVFTEQVVFRCTPVQKALWEKLAAADDRDLGNWIRRQLPDADKPSAK